MNTLPSHQRLLVIDDDRSIHEDFRKIFAFQAQETCPLERAERALLGGIPSPVSSPSIVIDFAFQGEDGFHQIRAAAKGHAGMDDFLTKPIVLSRLREVVGGVLLLPTNELAESEASPSHSSTAPCLLAP